MHAFVGLSSESRLVFVWRPVFTVHLKIWSHIEFEFWFRGWYSAWPEIIQILFWAVESVLVSLSTHTHTHTHTHTRRRPGVTGWNNRTHFWRNCYACSADEVHSAENQTFFSFQQCPSLNSVWGRERSIVDKGIQLKLWTLPSCSQALAILLYWLWQSLWLCESQETGKFFKRWEYQTTWPASWEICMQVKKQQLEPDMEQ